MTNIKGNLYTRIVGWLPDGRAELACGHAMRVKGTPRAMKVCPECNPVALAQRQARAAKPTNTAKVEASDG